METTHSKTSARDFFLWLGALASLYTAVTALINLLFEYINYTYPDSLAGAGDPYGSSMRFSMALLIVATPTAVFLFRLIGKGISENIESAQIWIRRWGIMLTLFISALVSLVDLVTLINTFLGGEITIRFTLKVAVVLLIAVAVFLHFLADLKGYWQTHQSRSRTIALASLVLVVSSIVASFFIIGSPSHIRDLRLDSQRVNDLSSIQSQALAHYQSKRALPKTLAELNNPLMYFTLPKDPATGAEYEYTTEKPLSFTLCATFSAPSPDIDGKGSYPAMGGAMMDTSSPVFGGMETTWKHEAGRTCFTRTIDPQLFPAVPSAVKGL